ncbi:hypothetical protein [Epilithonimonas vandammei]|uniref:hypothetical protein n=1 Tax=Epilithonimonas vandammei TaxID=2487072 RepID=UPI0028AB9691|nr:hypothetical protein [Epilithonimonas vandammei]
MKKLIPFLSIFAFCFAHSQIKNNKNTSPKIQRDSANKKTEIIKKDQSVFYKNVDSAKASKYKMLNKKPAEQYYELQQTKPQQYKTEKPKDSIQLKKK